MLSTDNHEHILFERNDFPWLPENSKLQCILTKELPKIELITGAFGLCFYEDKFLLVGHSDRDIDPPGGHREGLETAEQTLRREVLEEGCAILGKVENIAVLKIIINGPRQVNYRYPYPVSYMVAYVAIVDKLDPFIPKMETLSRYLLSHDEAQQTRWVKDYNSLYLEARKRLK